MKPHILALALALCGFHSTASAQAPPETRLSISPYFCCGATDRTIFTNNVINFAYDPARCNRPGDLGVHLIGSTVTFDDPMNEDKVCVLDASPLLANLAPGMWDIQTSTSWSGPMKFSDYKVRRGYGSHRSPPFAAGGFVPTSAPDPLPIYPETEITLWPASGTWPLGYVLVVENYQSVPWLASNCGKAGPPGVSIDAAHTTITFDDPIHNDQVCVLDARKLVAALPNGSWDIHVRAIWPMPIDQIIANGAVARSQPDASVSAAPFVITGSTVTPPTTAPPVVTGPECVAPLGAHAAAIFITQLETTTGRPGSRSRLNFQVAGPDAIRELGVLIDDVEVSTVKGADLSALGGVWFTQPAAGTHAIKVRVLNNYGCALVRIFNVPLVVQP